MVGVRSRQAIAAAVRTFHRPANAMNSSAPTLTPRSVRSRHPSNLVESPKSSGGAYPVSEDRIVARSILVADSEPLEQALDDRGRAHLVEQVVALRDTGERGEPAQQVGRLCCAPHAH